MRDIFWAATVPAVVAAAAAGTVALRFRIKLEAAALEAPASQTPSQ
jgi:hypothetical protein